MKDNTTNKDSLPPSPTFNLIPMKTTMGKIQKEGDDPHVEKALTQPRTLCEYRSKKFHVWPMTSAKGTTKRGRDKGQDPRGTLPRSPSHHSPPRREFL